MVIGKELLNGSAMVNKRQAQQISNDIKRRTAELDARRCVHGKKNTHVVSFYVDVADRINVTICRPRFKQLLSQTIRESEFAHAHGCECEACTGEA